MYHWVSGAGAPAGPIEPAQLRGNMTMGLSITSRDGLFPYFDKNLLGIKKKQRCVTLEFNLRWHSRWSFYLPEDVDRGKKS